MRLSLPARSARTAIVSAIAAALLVMPACSTATAVATSAGGAGATPRATSSPAPALPPVPAVDGPLRLRVVYPSPGALIQARDSTFIFGSLGSGRATLRVNGAAVRVEPNGSFLAWLPVPAQPRYILQATLNGRTATDTLAVRLLPPAMILSESGPLRVDERSVAPAGAVSYPASELVRVAVRAPTNARVVLLPSAGAAVPLVAMPSPSGRAADGAGVVWATEVAASRLAGGARLLAIRGADSIRLTLPAVTALPDDQRTLVRVGSAEVADSGDRRISARPLPGGTYRWFFVPGTIARQTAQAGGFVRLNLARGLDAWVSADDVLPLAAGSVAPRRVVGNIVVRPASEWVDVVLPMADVPLYQVDEEGNSVVLTLFDVTANTDIITYVANDSLVRHITWEPLADGRARFTIHLAQRPFGYLAFWRGNAFVLRVRRTPVVNATAPLRGLRIAVDPGHPPIGSTGPTGLYEAEATLAIGELLRAELIRRGVTVIMTRTTMAPVALGDRPIQARREDAHALVSVHLNALPDGINPFTAHGTGTYYFHPQSAPLARATQDALVSRLGLPNLGIHYDNLALARPTWMPAILAEGAFIMMPQQEAALRTVAFQKAYAYGLADGLENYFRGLATAAAAHDAGGQP